MQFSLPTHEQSRLVQELIPALPKQQALSKRYLQPCSMVGVGRLSDLIRLHGTVTH